MWAAVAGSWTPLVVVVACVIDGLADGIFAWLRARASFAAGSATDSRDEVLVREFLRTYLIVIGVQAVVAYMVFGGLLLKPGGEAPDQPGAAFVTWQYWAVVAGLVVMRGLVYWWDFVRGGEASVIPPEAVVAEPLRRLFVLQFGVLAGALLVYWAFDSSVTGLADPAGRQDGRRRRPRRARAAARGAHHGRGRRRRAPGAAARRRSRAPAAAGASGAADAAGARRRAGQPAAPALASARSRSNTISHYHDAICGPRSPDARSLIASLLGDVLRLTCNWSLSARTGEA